MIETTGKSGRPVGSGWSKLDHHKQEIQDLIQHGEPSLICALGLPYGMKSRM